MRFAVVENLDNERVVTRYVSSLEDMIDKIEREYTDIVRHDNISTEEVQKSEYTDNTYLLVNSNILTVVEKTTEVVEGYIYNSYKPKVEVLANYELIECRAEDKPKDFTNIKEFNFRKLPKYPTINIIGRKESGKTTTVLKIMEHYKDVPQENMLIISGKEHLENVYRTRFPKATIKHSYTDDVIRRFIDRVSVTNRTPSAVIIDDCLPVKGLWSKSPHFRNLFINNRHMKTVFITTMNYSYGYGPDLRANTDAVFLFRENFMVPIKRNYTHYGNTFGSFNDFTDTFNRITENQKGKAMVITGRGKVYSFKPEYKFKAD